MLNVAIVEDEKEAAELLKKQLNRYAAENGEAVKCTVFSYGEAFLNNYKPTYDLVFMDIMLSGMTGMEAAHKLREMDGKVALIFITSLAQFAVEGYSVRALDFIVKPVRYYDLKMRLERVLRQIEREERYLKLTVDSAFKNLKIDDLYFVQTEKHLLYYHTADGVFSSYTYTMKDLEEKLSAEDFARCSVSCLVNLRLIDEIKGNEISVKRETVFLSRGYRGKFMETFRRFTRGGGE